MNLISCLWRLSVWRGPPPRPPAASTRPASRESACSGGRPSCRGSSVCPATASAATAATRSPAGPPSTWESCCASSAQASTGRPRCPEVDLKLLLLREGGVSKQHGVGRKYLSRLPKRRTYSLFTKYVFFINGIRRNVFNKPHLYI